MSLEPTDIYDQRLDRVVTLELGFTLKEFAAYLDTMRLAFWTVGSAQDDFQDTTVFSASHRGRGTLRMSFAAVKAWVEQYRLQPGHIEIGAQYRDSQDNLYVVEDVVEPHDDFLYSDKIVLLRTALGGRRALPVKDFTAIRVREGKAFTQFTKVSPDL